MLLVEACEECDPAGRFVPHPDRRWATLVAWDEGGAPCDDAPDAVTWFLDVRTDRLAGRLSKRYPWLRRLERALVRPVPVVGPVLGAAGLGAALGASAIAPGSLWVAISALGVWNVVVVVRAFSWRLARLLDRPAGPGPGASFVDVAIRARLWVATHVRSGNAETGEEADWLAATAERFLALWKARLGSLANVRSEAALHLAATASLGGLLFGARTFDPETVAVVSMIAAPRALLGLVAGVRARRLAGRLRPSVADPSALRLVGDGAVLPVEVLPFGYELERESWRRVRTMLRELFGSETPLVLSDSTPSGSPAPGLWFPGSGAERTGSARRHFVLVFDLSTAPQGHVEGVWIDAIRKIVEDRGVRLLVLLEGEPNAERIRRWKVVLDRSGLVPVVLGTDADAESLRDLAAAASSNLWPPLVLETPLPGRETRIGSELRRRLRSSLYGRAA